MIKFTTASGTQYVIYDVAGQELITRVSDKPLANVYDFSPMDALDGEPVTYPAPPEIGETFMYYTDSHDWCFSTLVTEIEEE